MQCSAVPLPGGSANKLMIARNKKEEGCLDSEYYKLDPDKILKAEDIKKTKEKEEHAREEQLKRKLRNRKENILEGDNIVVKTETPMGKSKYDKTAVVIGRGDNGEVFFEMKETGAISTRTEIGQKKQS